MISASDWNSIDLCLIILVLSCFRSNRSSRSARSSVSQAKPKDHWVDKITVSSLAESRKSNKSQALSVRSAQAKSRDGSCNKSQNQLIVRTDQAAAQPESSQEKLKNLPSYICPSSEDKSKEYLCKVWVAHSQFRTAIRTLPLY